MGAVSKNVMEGDEWCKPTREVDHGQLLKLVHKTRKMIRETLQPVVVEAAATDDVVVLTDKKLPAHQPARFAVSAVPVYPVMPDRYRPLRFGLAALALAIASAGAVVALFVW